MSARRRTPATAAFLVAALVLGGPVRGQEDGPEGPEPPRALLGELKAERDRQLERYLRVKTSVERQSADLQVLRREHAAIAAQVGRLESRADLSLLERRELEGLRTTLARKSQPIARLQIQLDAQQGRLEQARLELIEACSAYAERLLEKADHTRFVRPEQTREIVEEAVSELAFLDDLERVQLPVREMPQIPVMTVYTDPEEIETWVGLLAEHLDDAEQLLARLRPEVELREARARRLDRLAQAGYAVPGLDRRLERAREQQAQVAKLYDDALQRASSFRAKLGELGRLLAEQGLRRAQPREGR